MIKFSMVKIVVVMALTLALMLGARSAYAQLDLWGDPLAGQAVGLEAFRALGLGNRDPRVITAAIIQIALGFLGVIAVVLILYGGWLWMSAAGDDSKIEKARTLITNAVIGLLIILSAFAITTFVLRALMRATGGPETTKISNLSTSCSPNGASLACGCGGVKVCSDGAWSECMGSDCSDAARGRRFCDANPLTRPMCEAKDSLCGEEQFCNASDCRCSPKAGYGEACDADSSLPSCQADDKRCGMGLKCEVDKGCVCVGEPIIQSLSPAGGFCQGDTNKACSSNNDCAGLNPNKCDLTTPNAAVGNLMTISGLYFLPYDPAVSKVYFYDGAGLTLEAKLASAVNINCKQEEAWTDRQIIVVVPAGAKNGVVKVVAANGSDQTDNASGYKGQLVINTLVRPGLCQVDPEAGKFDASINYYGTNLATSDAYFGSLASPIKADGQSFANNDSGFAAVPNIQASLTSTFVRKLSNGLASNYLQFKKEEDEALDPVIVSFEPSTANAGAYVTIRGRGFGLGREFDSTVYFGDTEADFVFPPECASSIWSTSQVVFKVPKNLNDQQAYALKIKVGDKEAAAAESFVYNKDLALAPSLCKIDPIFAQPNEVISLWGEYFDASNQFSKVRFYYNQDQSGRALEQWRFGAVNKADFIKTTIPSASLTGPVYVVKKDPELVGNGLNLNIGQCVRDEQCGAAQVCCPQGTTAAGRCKASADECYGGSDSCVFEWDFSTGTNNGCPVNTPNLCDDNRCCASSCQDNGNGQSFCGDTDGGDGGPGGGDDDGGPDDGGGPGDDKDPDDGGDDWNGKDPIPCDSDKRTAKCDKDNDLCQAKMGDLSAFCNERCICEMLPVDDKTRIKLEDYGPEGEQICRNTLIWVNFDRLMNVDSFNNNAMLIGDYGDQACPEGTALLAVNNRNGQSEAWYSQWWKKINQVWQSLLPESASADDGASNYCLVQTRARDMETSLEGVKKSRILLETKTVLSPDTKYYVIIRGDEFLNGSTGVKDLAGLGFRGDNKTEPLIASFNGLQYGNAQIWQFKTGQELCTIEKVEIEPAQAVFAAPNQLATMLALAKSKDGQPLVSTALYSFYWSNWLVENPELARLETEDLSDGQGLSPLARVIAGSKMDGRTVARATVKIDYDGLSVVSRSGETKSGNGQLIFFYCANPWPPRKASPANWPIGWWDDLNNNPTAACDVGDGNCLANDFQIYYCRDRAQLGTMDDLPPLASDPVVRANYFFGSGNQTTEVLKDIYFFRGLKPVPPTTMEISNDLTSQLGAAVLVNFAAIGKFDQYKVYYGQESGKYTNFVVVDRKDQAEQLSVRIGGFVNGRKYYFNITSVGEFNVESSFAQEQEFTVLDIVAPLARDDKFGQAPAVTSVKVDLRESANKKIIMTWLKEYTDVAGYKLSYGPNRQAAVELKLGLRGDYVIKSLNNLDNQDYYVNLSAFDKSGNQGLPVTYLCQKSCAGVCDCERQSN